MTTLTERRGTLSWFVEPALLRPALVDSFRRLTPRYQWRNPVMFPIAASLQKRRWLSHCGQLLWLERWRHCGHVGFGKGSERTGLYA